MVRLSWNFVRMILGTFFDGFWQNVSCCLHCLAWKDLQKALTLLFMLRLSWNFGWLILGIFYDGFWQNVSCCLHCLAGKDLQMALTLLFMLLFINISEFLLTFLWFSYKFFVWMPTFQISNHLICHSFYKFLKNPLKSSFLFVNFGPWSSNFRNFYLLHVPKTSKINCKKL